MGLQALLGGGWPAAAMMVGERDQLTPPRRNYPPQIPLRWVSGARYSNLRSSRNGGLGGKMEAGGSERDGGFNTQQRPAAHRMSRRLIN